MSNARYIFFIMAFIVSLYTKGQPFTAKSEKLYLKGESLMQKENYVKAEKIFLKIIDREEHGRAYYQLAVINQKNNVNTALAYYNTSLRLLTKEMEFLNSNTGGAYDRLSIENFIANVKEGIIACGGMTPEMILSEVEKPEFEEQPNSAYREVDSLNYSNADIDFTFYQSGQVSTYYTAIEKPLSGYRLPNYSELESCLSKLLTTYEGREQLKQLKQANKQLRFVSSDLYFSDENMHLSKGYIVDIDRIALIKEDIELGDLSSILLIKQ